MYLSVKSIPLTAMIAINLPLALVGSMGRFDWGVISIASLVGFITLFGVATRNGLLLVDNYNTKFAEGCPLKKLRVDGTAQRHLDDSFHLCTGFGSPVVEVDGRKSCNRCRSGTGGLFTYSLTLLVLPRHCTPSLARFWCRKGTSSPQLAVAEG